MRSFGLQAHVTPCGDKKELKPVSKKGTVGAEIDLVDGLFEVLPVADQAQGRRDESVPCAGELGHKAVVPVRRLVRGGHSQSWRDARPA